MTTARLLNSKSAGFHDVESVGCDLRSLCGIRQHHRAWRESKGAVSCPTCIARRAASDHVAVSAVTSALIAQVVAPPLPVMPLIRGRVVARAERKCA